MLRLGEYRSDRSVGIATDYGIDDRGSIPGLGKRFFCTVQAGAGAHPASHRMGTVGSFPRGKTAGPEAINTGPTSYHHTATTAKWDVHYHKAYFAQ
jgi:hypothetical protein